MSDFPNMLAPILLVPKVSNSSEHTPALAHKVGNAVEQAYRRSRAIDKRRQLMEAWAAFCLPSGSSNVLPMKRPQ